MQRTHVERSSLDNLVENINHYLGWLNAGKRIKLSRSYGKYHIDIVRPDGVVEDRVIGGLSPLEAYRFLDAVRRLLLAVTR